MPSQSVLATVPFTIPNLRFDPAGSDPTGLQLQFAFTAWGYPPADPVTGDWVNATWVVNGANYDGRISVGPLGDKILAKGKWKPWWRVLGVTLVPVKATGILVIT